jgi:hypothetical protein
MSHARKWSALLAMTAVIAAGCGSDSSSSESEGPNPGLGFSGVYTVQVTPVTENGKPSTETPPAAYEWVVQSTCDGGDGACVAVATAADADPKSNLKQSRTEFVYNDEQWVRAEPSAVFECKSNSSGEILAPPSGVHRTVLAPVGRPTDAPTQRLVGTIDNTVSGSCGGVALLRITVERKGDLPAGTAPLGDVEIPETQTPPEDVLQFNGIYSYNASYVSGPGSPTAQFDAQLIATPQCSRTSEACVIAAPMSGVGSDPVFTYSDGKFVRSFETAPRVCPSNPAIQVTSRVDAVLTPEDDADPASVLRGTITGTFSGECGAKVVENLVVTRLADSSDSEDSTASDGVALDGRYDSVWLTSEGRPTATGPAGVWNIDSSCVAENDTCVSAVMITVEGRQDSIPLVLDFVDGVWRGVTEGPAAECKNEATGEVLGESSPMIEVIVQPNSTSNSDEFLVEQRVYGTPPCTYTYLSQQLLRRTGDTDSPVPLPTGDALAAPVVNPLAMSLTGEYYIESIGARVEGISNAADAAKNATFVPLCTRNGSRCVAIQSDPENRVSTMFVLIGDQWIADYTGTPRSCDSKDPNSPRRTSANVHNEFTRTDTGDGPAQSLAGLNITTYGGDCPNTAQWTLQLTRLGDR